MPNTLGHLAVNGLVTRGLIRNAEIPWIYAGCLISDLPWIFQRVVRTFIPEINPYDLRLYAVNQASLAGCLLFCAVLAIITVSPIRIMWILSLGCLLHLFLDACQVKMANGVSLFIPFDWRIVRFDFFRPDSVATYTLTFFGLAYFFFTLRIARMQSLRWSRQPIRWGIALGLLSLYFVLPSAGMQQAMAADNHYVATLSSWTEIHAVRPIELDRARYFIREGEPTLETFSGEFLPVAGLELDGDLTISVRGQYTGHAKLIVNEYHVHNSMLRDIASYAGLMLVGGLWLWLLLEPVRSRFSTCGNGA